MRTSTNRSSGMRMTVAHHSVLFSLALGVGIAFGVRAQSTESARSTALVHPTSIEDPSGRALTHFHASLRNAERSQGRARITVWGASHVSSDEYTGFLRASLARRFGDAGPGVVLPARPFEFYAHQQVEISPRGRFRTVRARGGPVDHYGIVGAALEARRSAEAAVRLRANVDPVDRVRLLYLRRASGGHIEVGDGGARNMRVSTSGPLSAGVQELRWRGVDRVTLRTRGSVRLFGLSLERDRPGVIVDGLGVPGARFRTRGFYEAQTYIPQVRALSPDLLVFAYGVNESGFPRRSASRYRSEVASAIRSAKAGAPNASCLLIGPSDWPQHRQTWRARPRADEVIRVQRDVARRLGCGFFDLRAMMGGPLSMIRWVQAGYGLGDHIHFTAAGHQALARQLERALLSGYAR